MTENYGSILTSTITERLADILVKLINIRKSLKERPGCAPFKMAASIV